MTNHSVNEIDGAGNLPNSHSEQNTDNWWHYFTFNQDHKVIGIQYLVTSFIFFLIAGLLAMLIRAELITPASAW